MLFDEFENLKDILSLLPRVTKSQSKLIAGKLLYDKAFCEEFILCLKKLEDFKSCALCNVINPNKNGVCNICSDKNRNSKKLCIVSNYENIKKIEDLNSYNGKYFYINLEESYKNSKIFDFFAKKIFENIEYFSPKEIILATNPTLKEIAFVERYLILIKSKYKNIKITKLSLGIPLGLNIEYSDNFSLKESFLNRKIIK